MTTFIKILTLTFAASMALAKPLIPRQASMTGLTVVTNLQQLSLVYQDLTVSLIVIENTSAQSTYIAQFMTNNLQSLKNQSNPGVFTNPPKKPLRA